MTGTDAGSVVRLGGPARLGAGLFLGAQFFPRDVGLGNSYYDDQVPGSGALVGARAGYAVWDGSGRGGLAPRLRLEGELRLALSRTETRGGRAAATTSVLGWRAHAVLDLLADRPVMPFVLVGGGGETLLGGSASMAVPDTDGDVYAGAGATWWAGARHGVRLDARLELLDGRDDGAAVAGEIELGYVVRLGRPGPRVGVKQLAVAGPAVVSAPDATAPAPDATAPAPDATAPAPDATAPAPAPDSDPDPDHDGVPGDADRCAAQPETPNGVDDADGCPDQVPADLAAMVGVLPGISFANGGVQPTGSQVKQVIEHLAAVLGRYPSVRIELRGFTDARGDAAANHALSRRRAEYIKWALVDRGVADRRITTSGEGADDPRADNRTAAGRAANRRIEMRIIVGPGAGAAP